MNQSPPKSRKRFESLLQERSKDTHLLQKLLKKKSQTPADTESIPSKEIKKIPIPTNDSTFPTESSPKPVEKKCLTRDSMRSRSSFFGRISQSQDFNDLKLRNVEYQTKRTFFREMNKKKRF